METLSDVGTSRFHGIRTLTISVYATWEPRRRRRRRRHRPVHAGGRPGIGGAGALGTPPPALRRSTQRNSHERHSHRCRRGGSYWARHPPRRPRFCSRSLPRGRLHRSCGSRISSDLIRETANTSPFSDRTGVAIAAGTVVAYAARLDQGRLAPPSPAPPGRLRPRNRAGPGVGASPRPRQRPRCRHEGPSASPPPPPHGPALPGLCLCVSIPCGFSQRHRRRIRPRPRSLDQSARTSATRPAASSQDPPALVRPAIGAAAILVFVDCMKGWQRCCSAR